MQDVQASHGASMPISDVYLRAAYMMQQQQMALLQSSLNGSVGLCKFQWHLHRTTFHMTA